jgi:GTP-binding protein
MKIITAEFVGSADTERAYPRGGLTEIAFAGRSNVGKSSAINALLGRRHLASISKTPGHTRKLNFYRINDSFMFVDLPGYGYARVPLAVKQKWQALVERYLERRSILSLAVLIVDLRRGLMDSDMELTAYLQSRGLPFVLTATKADKLTRSQAIIQQEAIKRVAGDAVPIVLFSSRTGEGKKELWKEIKKFIEGTPPGNRLPGPPDGRPPQIPTACERG